MKNTFIKKTISNIISYFVSCTQEEIQYGYLDETACFVKPRKCTCPSKVYIYEHAVVLDFSTFIISPKGDGGKFIMKKWAGAAEGLTVITNTHPARPQIGRFLNELVISHEFDVDKDIVIEEDAILGANVTLLAGVTVGRGAIIGAGAVVRKNIPPYAVAIGNPAKVVSFVLKPDEIIAHEKDLYDEAERLSEIVLKKNYDKYYLKRLEEISRIVN